MEVRELIAQYQRLHTLLGVGVAHNSRSAGHTMSLQTPPRRGDQEEKKENVAAEARTGLLKVLLEHQFRPKFSSTPLRFPTTAKEETTTSEEPRQEPDEKRNEADTDQEQSSFTMSERTFLEEVLRSGDPEHISAAAAVVSDPCKFPKLRDEVMEEGDDQPRPEKRGSVKRRDSQMQQRLFAIHQQAAVKPSRVLERMSFLQHRNSLLEESFEDSTPQDKGGTKEEKGGTKASLPIQTAFSADSILASDEAETQTADTDQSNSNTEWDFFQGDLPSWLDGNQGVEVDDTGEPLETRDRNLPNAGGPFRILGTSANDASCHPHVMSPPLMEGLMNFVPETLSNNNFWLKYSLVRDGASLLTMLRHARSSTATLLAIETTEGHVFGSFTVEPWRRAQGWYGTREAFLWKMRRSRAQDIATTPASIYEQAMQESEIQVFPYRTGSMAVQYCSKDCLMLGRGEVLQPDVKAGKHYGHGLYLEANLLKGSTSTSETFGNPCLVDNTLRGSRFQVANIEVWTLTPHTTINDAQRSEFATLFLEGGRDEKDLDLLGILVGGSI